MLLLACAPLAAAEPEIRPEDLPRFKPLAPEAEAGTFKLRPGLVAQLAASEPLVASPVAMAFDEDGRLFIVEMIDYPERPHQRLGRIRVLTDTDGDGRYDKATVYAQDMAWPTAVFPWDGGIFVMCTPDILYFKDTRHDGVADVRRTVYTGFGSGIEKLNMQGLMNSFLWGLDNRIHGCSGYLYGKITAPGEAGIPPLDLGRRKGFVFDPRSLAIHDEHGGGQWGTSFDTAGRLYTCSNSNHIQVFAWDHRYGANNPRYNMPPALVDVAVDGPACEVYRISPEEPWRVVRTRWRVAGAVSGPIEGGGRASGYITSACAILIYTGTALGPDFAGDAFICEPAGNLVTRKKVFTNGAIIGAKRAAGEEKMEVFAAADTWCRPVWLSNAPDGGLWMVDMYREYIEHPWSLPPNLKRLMDLDSGCDRGRIWRIVPEGFKAAAPPKLGQASSVELVAMLGHPNGWHRETAARLLYLRQDRGAVEPLRKMVRQSAPPGALGALCALEGLSSLSEEDVIAALGRAHDEGLHLNALKLAEQVAGGGAPSNALWEAMSRLADGPGSLASEKQQLALTLGRLQHPGKVALLGRILHADPKDPWIRSAVLAAVGREAGDLFARLASDQAWLARPESRDLARQLLRLLGMTQPAGASLAAAERIGEIRDDGAALELAAALGAGMQQAKSPLVTTGPGLAIVARARRIAQSAGASPGARIAAMEVLALLPFAQGGQDVVARLAPTEPEALQLAAIAALDRWSADDVAGPIIARWADLPPSVKEAALAIMVKRPARAKALLGAIGSGAVKRSEISATHLAALRQSNDKTVKEMMSKLFAATGARRQDVVNRFLSAVELKGDRERGKKFFTDKCAQCHRLGGQGHALGPDLETVRDWNREKFLVAVLDPNRDILPSYMAYIVETTDNEQHLGILVAQSPASVTLKMANSKQVTIPRSEIESFRSANLSMMPEGQEDGAKAQDFADLMEFVLPPK